MYGFLARSIGLGAVDADKNCIANACWPAGIAELYSKQAVIQCRYNAYYSSV